MVCARRDALGDIDIVLCPRSVAGLAAAGGGAASFTQWCNLLGVPAGIAPVTLVQSDEAGDGSVGMPRCVQLVGRGWQDETVLAAMKVLEEAFPIANPPERATVEGSPSLAAAASVCTMTHGSASKL